LLSDGIKNQYGDLARRRYALQHYNERWAVSLATFGWEGVHRGTLGELCALHLYRDDAWKRGGSNDPHVRRDPDCSILEKAEGEIKIAKPDT